MPFRIDQLSVYNLATVSNSITAGSFVKSGGTSSQFLKADGSVDSSTYATQSWVTSQGYITIASVGNGTLTLNVSGNGLSGSTSFTANQSGNTTFTVTSNATTSATANTLVYRDGNADIYSRYSFGSYVNTTDNDESGITRFIIKNGDNYHRSATTSVAASAIQAAASGTWSINITGSAGSETLATVTGRGASTSTAVTLNNTLTVGSASVYAYMWNDGSGVYIESAGNTTATRKIRIQGNNGSGSYAQLFVDAGNLRVYTEIGGVANFLVDSNVVYLRNAGADKFWTGSDGTRNAGWLYMQNGGAGIHYPGYNSHFYMPGGNYWHINPTGGSSAGGVILYSDYNSTPGGSTYRKGYIYYDAGGFGLLGGGDANWAININPSTSKYVTIGGNPSLNAYNSTTGVRLMFGGGDTDAQGNYYIGTNLNNYGGNYNKLDLAWHTGIRLGAQPGYGGIRMYNDEDFTAVLFSVAEGDQHVRVTNNLYMGGNLVATQSWVSSQGYITGSYVPTAGGVNMTGSFGLNDNKLYLRTNGDNNHYLWNAGDDWEELNAYEGTGFRITSVGGSTGVLYVYGSSNGGYTYSPYSFRAPIFYDSNDTNYYVDPNGVSKQWQLTNAGALGTNASNARNHFTQYNSGTTSPAGGWIAAAFGDNTNNRVVIGQWNGNTGAIIGGHTANLDDWSGLSYVAKTHQFYANADYTGTVSMLLDTSHNLTLRGTLQVGSYFRNNGVTTNTVYYASTSESFGNILSAVSGSSRAAFFRADRTDTGASVWWGRKDGSGNSVPCGAIDSSDGQFTHWTNSGGTTGGWTQVLTVNTSGLTVNSGNIYSPIFYDSNNTSYYGNFASTSNLNGLNIVDGNLELYKDITVDMSGGAYSTSNYYPVIIGVPTSGVHIEIQNNLNSNVPSWSTHGSGFTINLRWFTNGSGWGTTQIQRTIYEYHQRFANVQICGGISQLGTCSAEVVWLRGGGIYYFKVSRNVGVTPYSSNYTCNSETAAVTSSIVNDVWSSATGNISTSVLYASIIYDKDDTAYYVDPNSTSKLVQVNLGTTNTRLIADVATGYVKIYGSASNYLAIGPYNNNGWVYQENVGNGNGTYYYVQNGRHAFDGGDVTPYADNNRNLGTGSYRWANVYAGTSVRAPIFYDSDNTGYYLDPSSTTSLRTVGSWRSDSSSWDGEFSGKIQYHSNSWYIQGADLLIYRNAGGSNVFTVNQSGNGYFSGSLTTGGQIYINNGDPTIFLQDVNHRSSMIHCNSNIFYILRGSGNNSTSWSTYNGYWPLEINLDNNNATFGGSVTAVYDFRAPIFYDSDNTAYYADFANSGTSIKTAGNVLIGQTYDPGNKLQVNGNIYAVGDVTAYSDIRVKTNIRSIERVVERIMNIRGVIYDRTDIESNDNIGFIAQELEEQFPELIHTNNDGTKGVKYQNMTAILVEVVKKQQKQIDELKARLN